MLTVAKKLQEQRKVKANKLFSITRFNPGAHSHNLPPQGPTIAKGARPPISFSTTPFGAPPHLKARVISDPSTTTPFGVPHVEDVGDPFSLAKLPGERISTTPYANTKNSHRHFLVEKFVINDELIKAHVMAVIESLALIQNKTATYLNGEDEEADKVIGVKGEDVFNHVMQGKLGATDVATIFAYAFSSATGPTKLQNIVWEMAGHKEDLGHLKREIKKKKKDGNNRAVRRMERKAKQLEDELASLEAPRAAIAKQNQAQGPQLARNPDLMAEAVKANMIYSEPEKKKVFKLFEDDDNAFLGKIRQQAALGVVKALGSARESLGAARKAIAAVKKLDSRDAAILARQMGQKNVADLQVPDATDVTLSLQDGRSGSVEIDAVKNVGGVYALGGKKLVAAVKEAIESMKEEDRSYFVVDQTTSNSLGMPHLRHMIRLVLLRCGRVELHLVGSLDDTTHIPRRTTGDLEALGMTASTVSTASLDPGCRKFFTVYVPDYGTVYTLGEGIVLRIVPIQINIDNDKAAVSRVEAELADVQAKIDASAPKSRKRNRREDSSDDSDSDDSSDDLTDSTPPVSDLVSASESGPSKKKGKDLDGRPGVPTSRSTTRSTRRSTRKARGQARRREKEKRARANKQSKASSAAREKPAKRAKQRQRGGSNRTKRRARSRARRRAAQRKQKHTDFAALPLWVQRKQLKRKIAKIKKRILRREQQVKDIVNDFHNRTASHLVSSYDTILLPKFKVSSMVKSTGKRNDGSIRRINRSVTRSMMALQHGAFRTKLINMAKSRGVRVVLTNEAYTSKTCSMCGKINSKLGGSEWFRCPDPGCGFETDRDANAGRGIILRHWDKTTEEGES